MSLAPRELRNQINDCLQADRPALRRRLRQLEERLQQHKPAERMQGEIEQAIAVSKHKLQQRREHLPKPTFDDFLPVNQRRDFVP